jgi:hypothetical protein
MKYLIIGLVLLVIGLLIGGGIGFTLGIQTTIHALAKVVPMFVDIQIDEQALNDALFKYNNRLAGDTNALIHSP